MGNRIITIGREFGSGGRTIGQEVAKKLGIPCYDHDLIDKLAETLSDLLETLGDREIALCRELTKLHEEVIRTTIAQALERFRQDRPRGEFVLVIRGAPVEKGPRRSLEEALSLVEELRSQGRPLKEAAKMAAAETGQSRNDLYHAALVREKEN